MSSVHWCWPVEKLFLIVYLVHGASERFHIFDCGQTRRIPNRQTNLHPGEYTFISAQLFIYMFSLYVARKCRQGIFLVAFLRAPFENATRQCCIKFIRQRPKSNNIEAIVSLSSKNNNNNHKWCDCFSLDRISSSLCRRLFAKFAFLQIIDVSVTKII